jgi:hypothetical protein
MPIAHAILVGRSLIVPACPFCGRRHIHGGVIGGVRLSHCLRDAAVYLLELMAGAEAAL